MSLVIKTESECVNCGLPCLRYSCPYFSVTRFYCDDCGDEVEDLYWFGNEQLCIDCVAQRLERVELDD